MILTQDVKLRIDFLLFLITGRAFCCWDIFYGLTDINWCIKTFLAQWNVNLLMHLLSSIFNECGISSKKKNLENVNITEMPGILDYLNQQFKMKIAVFLNRRFLAKSVIHLRFTKTAIFILNYLLRYSGIPGISDINYFQLFITLVI